jgi:bacteriocin-like protein
MNFCELTDEQLEEVVGGDATNYSNQDNWAYAPTSNTAAFAKNVYQTGSSIYQSNTTSQTAFDFAKVIFH